MIIFKMEPVSLQEKDTEDVCYELHIYNFV